MLAAEQPDMKGEALNAQRFHMLEDIAKELSGEVVFPTSFDLAMRIRKALQDDSQSIAQIVAQLSIEPLINVKLLQLANSVAYNPGGVTVRDVKAAVSRLGLETVRSVVMAITMNQMMRARDMLDFDDLAQHLWRHSLQSASAAYVIARRLTRISPDEAMLAGLVHDLGAFYMLYRATQYEELRARPDTVKYLIAQWHESIGVSILSALDMPEEIVEAVRDHDVLRPPPPKPRTLKEVLFMGNMMAGGMFEWIRLDVDQETVECYDPGEPYLSLRDEIEAHAAGLRAVFG